MDDETKTLKLGAATIHVADDGALQVRFEDSKRDTWEIAPGDVERLYGFLQERRSVPAGIG